MKNLRRFAPIFLVSAVLLFALACSSEEEPPLEEPVEESMEGEEEVLDDLKEEDEEDLEEDEDEYIEESEEVANFRGPF